MVFHLTIECSISVDISKVEALVLVTTEFSPPSTVAVAEVLQPGSPVHLKWFVDTGERLKTADGKTIEVWELRHEKEEETLSAWAKHFRAHYCSDASIDFLRGQLSRKKYLDDIKFPSRTSNLGPAFGLGTSPRS